jgi:hypothetical protein
MGPPILTGGPAVKKSTCGRALAVERDRVAPIDGDDIRQLIVAELVLQPGGVDGLGVRR